MLKSAKGKIWGRSLWVSAIATLALIAAYWQRDFLLLEIGKAWAVNDPACKVDAIVVLGGGEDTRPAAAASLYRAGVAPLILFMNVKPTAAEKMGIGLTEAEVTRRLLLSNGVPESAIQNIGTNVASTFDEACAVREWSVRPGMTSIEIVTDVFHTRRARWVFKKEMKGTGVQIHISGVPTLDYTINDWWKHEQGVIAFQNEVAKYIYYRLAH